MAVLQVLKGLTPGQMFPIEGTHAVLGRHPECDIVLDVGAVSRRHAEIVFVDGEYYVRDLQSRNGTFVNGVAVAGEQRLDENDRLKICDLLFTFHHQLPTGRAATTSLGFETDLALVDDSDDSASKIMSTLGVSSADTGLRVAVRPEIKLRALLEIAHSLGRVLSLDEVLPRILDSLFRIFVQADRAFVLLRETPGGPLVPKAVRHRRESDETVRISRTIVDRAMNLKEAILSADAASDSRFDMSQSVADFRIRSMMCAPLVDSEGRALGVIQVDTLAARSRFQQDDLDLLASVARQAALAVENAQLHEQAIRQERIERDLTLAHEVQKGFLPTGVPRVEGYRFFDFYEPANELGGDFYDYVDLPDGRLAVVVADVSGKGIAASLLMVKLAGEIRFLLASEPQPDRALTLVNRSFLRSHWEGRFVTLVLAVLDPLEHRLAIVNAGHMPPLVRRADGEVEAIGGEQAGLPLGVADDTVYQTVPLVLEPGDSLVMFTDGISEAMGPDAQLYGLARLRSQMARRIDGVESLGRTILDDVQAFVGDLPQNDDMCLACLGRLAE